MPLAQRRSHFSGKYKLEPMTGLISRRPLKLACGGSISASAATSSTTEIMLTLCSNISAYELRCVVTNACGQAIRNPINVVACFGDFNCDTIVDFADYLDFVQAFATHESIADFNQDGVLDLFDYFDFVDAFTYGCA
jgi:hypothetical protein